MDVPYDPDNIFSGMIAGTVPCIKVYENRFCLSFMDIYPQSTGHCLVVHKSAQAADILSIEADALGDVITTVKSVAHGIRNALEPAGIQIVQYNGAAAGQTVFHLHFHIIPVYEKKSPLHHGSSARVPDEDLERVARKIRKSL